MASDLKTLANWIAARGTELRGRERGIKSVFFKL